ncbi:nitric oxide synthase, inducible-like [Aplysia californica]|uniref:nitric-oxide synthase (NADPH) n=1 Tax=Aplysia californica TaxID=6500 RepID=A0ABM1AC01_APLCA|nr:nitric oxide synthase, inducible-like [Aplysia californica]
MNLGWKPKYGRFDVLPLVISVAGADPVVFDIPPDLVMEPIAEKLGLDTMSNSSLWKDRALVEINVAVLHSFQTAAWLTHVWEKDRGMEKKKQIPFKILSHHLWSKTLAQRVMCTILFASETGRSESFADNLYDMCKPYFNAKVVCMKDYMVSDLCNESLLLVVTSTFGNGDPPVNGQTFDKGLKEMIKNSATLIENGYSVFALGSKAYPHFAEFGKTVDKSLSDLGATRVHKVGEGDELHGQEHSFDTWAGAVVEAACKSYNIVPDKESKNKKETSRKAVQAWTPDTYRLLPQPQTPNPDLCTGQ